MRVLKEKEDARLASAMLSTSRGNDDQGAQSKTALSSSDMARIRIACDDIPHTLTPFADWGVSCDALRDDLVQKRMRRFGAILRHGVPRREIRIVERFLTVKRRVQDALGETENTHDLSIALQKASTALQYTVAVRDKFLQAYREIMQMQI